VSTRAGRSHADDARAATLTLGALGVVFGDIGTSPLYAVQTVFSRSADRPVAVTPDDVYGVISLVVWAVVIIVTLKYVVLIMSADNEGEGGIMALIALLRRVPGSLGPRALAALAAAGLFGASLFFGDSLITPAISVLSAVEGLEVAAPSLHDAIVPLTATILVLLFAAQRWGTAAVGRLFGPVMAVWFTALGLAGLREVANHPGVLRALSPTYAAQFFARDGLTAFLALGGVVLAVTGAEALYADMGHFGRAPIRRAWLFLVFPALALNYLGQGALLTHDAAGAANPFYLMLPHWSRIPMVVLATAATVIASQAVISGAFSVTRQAVQLGYLPRVRIRHTSEHEIGQIYVPLINWSLLVGVLILVFAFEHSSKLAAAYGLAVTGTITTTTALFFVFQLNRGRWPRWLVLALAGAFLTVDLSFLGANLVKIPTGGWLPLLIGAAVYTVLSTWQRGREIVTRNRSDEEGPLRDFVAKLRRMRDEVARVPGTAVFLNRQRDTTPLAMHANVKHNHALHEHVVILSIETLPVPHAPIDKQLQISDLGFRDDGISHVTARAGFQDVPDVTAALRAANERGLECPLEIETASYFLSIIELRVTDAPGMARWRKRLFVATANLAADPVEYFRVPRDRTVLMGWHIDV
jgi:KUP system potassium uptake protein